MNTRKRTQQVDLGKCPNCSALLRPNSYGTIPLKGVGSSLEEDLIVCNNCLSKPEILSPEVISENLSLAEVKWEEGDIQIAVSAVQAYKDSKI